MPKSTIDPNFEFNENRWVVSILSTCPRKHTYNLIVVEGVKPVTNSSFQGGKFIGQYSIGLAFLEESGTTHSNGLTPKIQVLEGNTYPRVYSQYPARTYYVDPNKAELMISSIKNEQKIPLPPGINNDSFPFNQYLGPKLFQLTKSIERYQRNWCTQKIAIAGIDNKSVPKPQCSLI